jgi:hypothetical protein
MLICNWTRLSWCLTIHFDCVVLCSQESRLNSFLDL